MSDKENNSGCGLIGIILFVGIVVFSLVQILSDTNELYDTGRWILGVVSIAAGIGVGVLVSKKTDRGWLAIISGIATTAVIVNTIMSDDESIVVAGAIFSVIFVVVLSILFYVYVMKDL